MTAYAIKAEVGAAEAASLTFPAHKTMYGGKAIAVGDVIYIFASDGPGLVAKGVTQAVAATPRKAGVERQTPRIDLTVRVVQQASKPLGKAQLKPFETWGDGRPQTELNFKFYRQATDKVVGLSAGAAAYLEEFFPIPPSA